VGVGNGDLKVMMQTKSITDGPKERERLC